MIRVDARTLTALYDRRIDLSAGTAAAHPDDATIGAVRAVGQVEAVLPDGRFRVSLLNQILNLTLPPATQPGDRVPMRLVDGAWLPATQETQASAATTAANAPASALLAEGEPEPRLSAAVRLVAELAQQSASGNLPARVSASGSLIATPPQEPKELARAIRQAIVESGLFYESHQAEWLAGERTLTDLRAEPQGKLPPLPALAELAATPPPGSRLALPTNNTPLPAASTAARGSPQANEYVSIAALAQGESDLIATDKEASATGSIPATLEDTAAKNSTGPASGPVHADALPLVRQQLDVLAQPTVVWAGELWPGQPGEIEIRDERTGRGGTGETPAFATHLTLTLPRLGEVEAIVRLQGTQLQLRLRGAGDATTEMRGALPGLDAALAALGLPMRDLAVSPHET